MLPSPGKPLVSAVIPAFNAERTLDETLASVQAQTYSPLEIILVDDGSTDRTPEIMRRAAREDPRIRVISQGNAGVAAARNAGIAAARGTYVAPVDADDLWHPRKIELQMDVVARSGCRLGFVYSWSRRIDARGMVLDDQGTPEHRGHVLSHLIAFNFVGNASAALLDREAVEAAGGFDPGLQVAGAHGAEDVKLLLAIAEQAEVDVAPYFLVGYRQLPTSMSRSALRMRRSAEIVLNDLERCRPDLPPRLLELGQMNYDLYAANLALAARDVPLCARLLASGIGRAPVSALTLVGWVALWRAGIRLTSQGGRRRFDEMEPGEPAIRLPLANWLTSYQRRMVERAARGWRAPLGAVDRSAGSAH